MAFCAISPHSGCSNSLSGTNSMAATCIERATSTWSSSRDQPTQMPGQPEFAPGLPGVPALDGHPPLGPPDSSPRQGRPNLPQIRPPVTVEGIGIDKLRTLLRSLTIPAPCKKTNVCLAVRFYTWIEAVMPGEDFLPIRCRR